MPDTHTLATSAEAAEHLGAGMTEPEVDESYHCGEVDEGGDTCGDCDKGNCGIVSGHCYHARDETRLDDDEPYDSGNDHCVHCGCCSCMSCLYAEVA